MNDDIGLAGHVLIALIVFVVLAVLIVLGFVAPLFVRRKMLAEKKGGQT